MHHQPALRCGPTHLLLLPERDLGHRPGDLAGHKRLAAARGLVVEQDAVADVHPVGLAVCDVARTGRRGAGPTAGMVHAMAGARANQPTMHRSR